MYLVLHRDQSIIHTLIPCAWYMICGLWRETDRRTCSTIFILQKKNTCHILPPLHRFLWEQKVAKKVKVCKLFRNFPHVRSLWEQKVAKKVWKLSLSTVIARSGAKVCKLFALQMWQKKVARRKKYRFGFRQNHELFSRVTQPIQSVVHNHTREPYTTHTTPNMDGHG